MNAPLAPWIGRFAATVAEERRNKQLRDYRRDSLLIQEGKRAADERLAAVAGRERYEPDTHLMGGD